MIPSIHKAVYKAASQPQALEMGTWHSCANTHCRSGWVVTLAGPEGKNLEERFGTLLAAMKIYDASDPNFKINPCRFFDSNEDALADMKKLAGDQEIGPAETALIEKLSAQAAPTRKTVQCVKCGEVKTVPHNYPSPYLICCLECAAKEKSETVIDGNSVYLIGERGRIARQAAQAQLDERAKASQPAQPNGDNVAQPQMISNTNDSPMPGTKEWTSNQKAASRELETTALRRAAEELWEFDIDYPNVRLSKEAWIAGKIAQWTAKPEEPKP